MAVLRANNGNRTRSCKQIKMPIKTLRYKFPAMEVLGFEIPPYKLSPPFSLVVKLWLRILLYFKEAIPIVMLGIVVIGGIRIHPGSGTN